MLFKAFNSVNKTPMSPSLSQPEIEGTSSALIKKGARKSVNIPDANNCQKSDLFCYAQSGNAVMPNSVKVIPNISKRRLIGCNADSVGFLKTLSTNNSTPARLTNRNKEMAQSSDEEDNDSDDKSSDSSDTAEQQRDNVIIRENKPVKIVADDVIMSQEQRAKAAVEKYFTLHCSKTKSHTSNRTLDCLGASRPDSLTVQRLLKEYDISQQLNANTTALSCNYQPDFTRWMLELQVGYNILLYGIGSKLQLLQSFRETMLCNKHCVVIKGYLPNITIRQILGTITDKVLKSSTVQNEVPPKRDINEQVAYIKQRISNQESQLYLLVHNIDGPNFRSSRVQTIFCSLASCPNIHLIASVDHIRCPLLWSQTNLSELNCIWKHCPTLEHYTEETNYENSLMIQQSGVLVMSSLCQVIFSLTYNARQIFMFLLEYQLETLQEEKGAYQGMTLDKLYWKCRDSCLVNNDVTLRAQLNEFKDHKLIKFKKGKDGCELLIIPINAAILLEFKENYADNL